MRDHRAELIRCLELMGLSDEWNIAEPVDGEILDIATNQNAHGLSVDIPLAAANIHDGFADDEANVARIQTAITKAILLAMIMRIETRLFS